MTKEMQQMLIRFKKRYEDIQESPRDNEIKTIRMTALMTDMENTFQIPQFGADRIEAFKRAFEPVYLFYREVSYARVF